ncbi:MAG: NAD(P)/FAD-dependent oxidoreductase [Parachlamydiaceae bacterium]
MNIAILGAGFCGVALAWNLLSHGHRVTLFDPNGVGGEASKIAAGLLHKYTGPHAKLNRLGIEGQAATLELLELAQKFTAEPIVLAEGICRIAFGEEKREEYRFRAQQYPDCEWLETEEISLLTDETVLQPSLLIKSGLTIDCINYIKGLWQACLNKGGTFIQEKIQSVNELQDFHAIGIATGAKLPPFKELSHIPIKPIKGQLLEFSWPNLPVLPFSLNADAYLTMKANRLSCVGGATFEREFTSTAADIRVAKELLLPKLVKLFPPLANAKILNCQAGLRASTPDHLPIIGHYGQNLFAITGMGSKGLLYHALYAKKLCKLMLGLF